jgi:hypothetical protein
MICTKCGQEMRHESANITSWWYCPDCGYIEEET